MSQDDDDGEAGWVEAVTFGSSDKACIQLTTAGFADRTDFLSFFLAFAFPSIAKIK